MEILNPLQVAREDIHLKTVSLFESLKSNDTRIIQLLLQGAIQTQVNQVRLASIFMSVYVYNIRYIRVQYLLTHPFYILKY